VVRRDEAASGGALDNMVANAEADRGILERPRLIEFVNRRFAECFLVRGALLFVFMRRA
jgi:hypothetical protein